MTFTLGQVPRVAFLSLTSKGDFTSERDETVFADTKREALLRGGRPKGVGEADAPAPVKVVMEKRPSGFFNHITFTYHFYFPAHLVALSTFCPRAKQCLNCTSHSHRAKCSKRPSGVNEKRDAANRIVPVDRAYDTILLLHVWSV